MNPYLQTLERLPAFKEINTSVSRGECPISVVGLSLVHKAQMIYALSSRSEGAVLVVADDEVNAKRICDDINTMSGSETAIFYPAKELILSNVDSRSNEYEYSRIGALSKLISGECKILTMGTEAAMQFAMPKSVICGKTIAIRQGKELDSMQLAQALVACGYKRFDKVEGVSQFSIRGSIIDIFPVGSPLPVRLELWGDEVDSLAYFEIESQRRTDNIDEILIPPASEMLFDANDLIEKITLLRNGLRGKNKETQSAALAADIEKLKSDITPGGIDKYFRLIHPCPETVFDYFDNALCIVCEGADCDARAKSVLAQHNEDLNILTESGQICRGLEGFYLDREELVNQILSKRAVYLETFLHSGGRGVEFRRVFSINALQSGSWGGEMKQLIEELGNYVSNGYSTILALGSDKTLPTVCSDLAQNNIPCCVFDDEMKLEPSKVYLVSGGISGGYEYRDIKCALVTAARISAVRRKIKKRKKSEEIRSLSDISVGDLIVHSLHGIGRFDGIRKLEMEGVTKDYITIKYAGTDVLYVPVTQLDMVSKYIGARDDGNVRLSKLSSNEWQKTRSSVKRAVKDMAKELIALYAKRSRACGFAFDKDNEWQHDFEERFEYVETDDQLQCIDEIKSDMEKSRPMDRLLCGDVGFGKTEVALRAAFKCIMSGKQCAILAPTTVLAMQHYQTAMRRFEHFPIKIEQLSRFCTAKQTSSILKRLKAGQIDLIIGTHRVIQKDVEFYDLGLAIIDEEQRFGVAHKERFKEMFVNVDVLTLSATPIPRTLNMAMSGIRDMSTIDEPPQDRYPVQTYVVEHDWGLLAQAVSRELRRGGQVYYIHNRIESILTCAAKLQKLLPEAKIGIAHGRLNEDEMSQIWKRLVDREIDILVCTTIIETGVDVPNVNTLIIDNADRFGLSQLYQLRGRVGRSTRRAFAYFTFRPGKELTEIASKRLDAIRRFTQFGSGFHIAMRDLEIRGAGDILGGSQHGHMDSVGYDMYLRLLSEAIAEEKGEPAPKTSIECMVDIRIEAHIPEKYIESLPQRLDIYRKIAALTNDDDSADLIDELIDRYGDPPKAILGLIDIALLRNSAAAIGITEISQRNENLLFFTQTASLEQISSLSGRFRGRVLYNNMAKSYISVKLNANQKPLQLMREVIDTMSLPVPSGQ